MRTQAMHYDDSWRSGLETAPFDGEILRHPVPQPYDALPSHASRDSTLRWH